MIDLLSDIPAFQKIKKNGNTWGEFDFLQCKKDSFNKVSQVYDISGNNNHLLQLMAIRQPLFTPAGILYDGIYNAMQTLVSTLPQPVTVYFIAKEITFTDIATLYSGYDSAALSLYQRLISGVQYVRQLSNVNAIDNPTSVIGKLQLYCNHYNGANSFSQIDNKQKITGTVGTLSPNGFTVGSANYFGNFSNILFKGALIRYKSVDNENTVNIIKTGLATKYNVIL